MAYKLLYDGQDFNDEQENVLNWFITMVIPVVHVASRTKHNWRPFAFQNGIPPLYSTFVTTSDEAFALFLLKHYRNPPPPKEEKPKKTKTPVKIGGKKKGNNKEKNEESQKDNTEDQEKEKNNDDDDDNDKEQDESQKQKRSYKKKIDIRQGEKDYKKWMKQLKIVKSTGGKEAINKMDQKICSMIIEYRKKLQKDGVNVSSEIANADIIDVPDSDNENNNNYVDLDMVGGGVFEA